MAACSLSLISFISLIILLIVRKLFWVSRVPSLKNKHVLVTGGSSGIGKAAAIEASKCGANVTVIARNAARLEAAVEEVRKMAKCPQQQKIQYLVLDVTKGLAVVEDVVQLAEASAGPVFLLVNCVGMAKCVEFERATESDFRCMMDSNYYGTVFPTISVARRMKPRKEGHIAIIASQSAFLGFHGAAPCSPPKFALRGFAESLSMELRPHNVSVTVGFPPDTDTPGFASERESAPRVTRLVSVPGELFQAEEVARRLLSDCLRKKFVSTVGLEGFVMSTLCAGMSPPGSPCDVLLQVSLMGILRLVSVGYHFYYRRVIAKALQGGNCSKKAG